MFRFSCCNAVLCCITLICLMSQVSSEFLDSNGRLTQVEYANKASAEGGTVIGICSDDTAVLLTWSAWVDRNVEPPQKIHRITDYTGISSSGIVSDVNFLTDRIFEEATEHSFIFGSDPPAIRLGMSLANYVHDRTISARYRPLGIRTCIASYDDAARASILEIDAIGNLHKCKLTCIGLYAQKFLTNWDKSKNVLEMDPSEMIKECLNNLKKCVEEDEIIISADEINIAIVSKDKPFSFLADDCVSMAVEKDDYSGVKRYFSLPVIPSSLI